MRTAPAVATALAVAAVFAAGVGACKRSGPIDKLRDALIDGDDEAIATATKNVPACEPSPGASPAEGCLPEIAAAFGSKTGFQLASPDQAAAAAVALILARTRRGDWLPAADTWRAAMATGAGPGADALRLSVARAMASQASAVGRAVSDDGTARAFPRAVAESIPGACATYAVLAEPGDVDILPPGTSPDHDPCVHRDSTRQGGPGAKYGTGLWRGVHAASTAWRAELEALRAGAGAMTGAARAKLDEHLTTLTEAAEKTKLRAAPPRPNEALEQAMDTSHPVRLAPATGAKDAGTRAHP